MTEGGRQGIRTTERTEGRSAVRQNLRREAPARRLNGHKECLAVRRLRYPLLDARYSSGLIVRLDRAELEKPGTVMEAFVVE